LTRGFFLDVRKHLLSAILNVVEDARYRVPGLRPTFANPFAFNLRRCEGRCDAGPDGEANRAKEKRLLFKAF
jgi:hypothetical protein